MPQHTHVHEYLRAGGVFRHEGAGHLPLGALPVGTTFSSSGTKLADVAPRTGAPVAKFVHDDLIDLARRGLCGLLPPEAEKICLGIKSPGNGVGNGFTVKPCLPPFFWNAASNSCELDIIPGGGGGGVGAHRSFGPAVMGFYGAAIEPGTLPISRRTCPRGTVLGNDGLCYNKIANSDRMWPKGRPPLLTGGDLNAITRAKRASTKIQNKVRDLQGMGMLPTKAPSRRRKKAAAIALPAATAHPHLLLSGG